MFKPPRGKGEGSGGWKGGKKFGGNKSWERGTDGRKSGKTFMHKAVCESCGEQCQVPFVPNGRKPVFCSFCFNKEGQPKSPKSGGFEDRKSREQPNSAGVQEQLKALNVKLDTILRILNSKE